MYRVMFLLTSIALSLYLLVNIMIERKIEKLKEEQARLQLENLLLQKEIQEITKTVEPIKKAQEQLEELVYQSPKF